MRLSRIEREQARVATSAARKQDIHTDFDGLACQMLGVKKLNPTQRDFIFYPGRRSLFMGPVGAAKTSALVARVLMPALLYPGSRHLISRAHWWTLEQTTLKKVLAALLRLGPAIIIDKKTGPPMQIWIAPAMRNPDGSAGEPSELVFHGLDDMDKLGSQEFSSVSVDEVNELPEVLATGLDERLRHKLPSQESAIGPFFWNGVCNPVTRAHWIHRKFCGEHDCDAQPWGKKFRPQRHENEANLPPNYYSTISEGMTPERRVRMIEGDCGPDPSGNPVFMEFRNSLHVGDLKPIPGLAGIRGWDFGRRRPAVVWAQLTPQGWLNRLLCELGDNESLSIFAARVKMITETSFPQIRDWKDVCDPHGTRKVDVSDESSIDVLNRLGIFPRWRDVSIATRLEKMSAGLCTLVGGRPRSMYDRLGCANLIDGYAGGYTWPMPRPGQLMKEKPVADGFYEHYMDADGYIEVNLNYGSTVPMDQHRKNLRKGRLQ